MMSNRGGRKPLGYHTTAHDTIIQLADSGNLCFGRAIIPCISLLQLEGSTGGSRHNIP